jgi:hypothetical protein
MAVIAKSMIDDVELTIRKDVANAEVTANYTVNWSTFDQLTNLSYTERWELVGVDPGGNTTLYIGPSLVGGISSNGNTSTERTHVATIPWTDLDEDPNGLDEIAVVVTLTPLLPVARTAQSAQVTVTAP